MGADEDKKFDTVVASFVHRTLREQTARIHCPQADVLAAYHERSLSSGEMIVWKEHIAACAHCQQVLAHLEATESISVQASQEEEVPVMPAAMATAAAPAARAAEVREISSPPRQPFHLYWRALAPLGAIAAGFLIWIAIRETNPQPRPIEIAENRPAIAPPVSPAPQSSTPAAEADIKQRDLKLAERTGNIKAKIQSDVETFSQHSNENKDSRESRIAGAPAGALSARPISPPPPPGKALEQIPAPGIGALRQRNQPAPLLSGQAADEAQMKSVPSPPPPLQSKSVSGDRVKLASPLPAEKPSAPPTATETVEVTSSAGAVATKAATGSIAATRKDSLSKQEASRAAVAAQAAPDSAKELRDEDRFSSIVPRSALIRAPGGRVVWTAGDSGQILRSLDAGKTWQAQPSGVTTALLAGAATSEVVCWIVGAEGTILRTTDGGAHWLRVSSPPSTDLIGISASDADHAVLSTPSMALRYATNDGGKTWWITNK